MGKIFYLFNSIETTS